MGTEKSTYGPDNPHSLSMRRTEHVGEGKYEGYQRREVGAGEAGISFGRGFTRAVTEGVIDKKSLLTDEIMPKLDLSGFPDVIHGSRKEHSFITNAAVHTGKRYVLNIDIKKFFPSTKPNHVYNMFLRRMECSHGVVQILKKLCTADEHLPQGYNTSPRIANLVLIPVVERIHGLCKKQGLNLSVFVDDITISGNKDLRKYFGSFEKIINECGYKVKAEKKVFRRHYEKQKVTGVIVNKKQNIDKEDFKDIRSKLHICQKHGPTALFGKIKNKRGEELNSTEKIKKHLMGVLSHFNQINPERTAKMKLKFDAINW